MALADNALTTLATANDELGLTSDGGTVDARVERYINAASALFEQMCGRGFHRKAAHLEEVESAGGELLRVKDHLPLVSVSSIVFDDGSTATTVDADNYELRESGKPLGHIRRISGFWASTEMVGVNIEPVFSGRREALYQVTYTGGYLTPKQDDDGDGTRTLPYDIEEAVIDQVKLKHALRAGDPSVTRLGLTDGSITYATGPDGQRAQVASSFAAAVGRYRLKRGMFT